MTSQLSDIIVLADTFEHRMIKAKPNLWYAYTPDGSKRIGPQNGYTDADVFSRIGGVWTITQINTPCPEFFLEI